VVPGVHQLTDALSSLYEYVLTSQFSQAAFCPCRFAGGCRCLQQIPCVSLRVLPSLQAPNWHCLLRTTFWQHPCAFCSCVLRVCTASVCCGEQASRLAC
jgi:hypothetical protein